MSPKTKFKFLLKHEENKTAYFFKNIIIDLSILFSFYEKKNSFYFFWEITIIFDRLKLVDDDDDENACCCSFSKTISNTLRTTGMNDLGMSIET